MSQDRFETLREVLHEAPSEAAWSRLAVLFAGWPERDDAELGVSYAARALSRWPDALCVAPLASCFELVCVARDSEGARWRFEGLKERPHPAWALSRVLDLRSLVGGLSSAEVAALARWPYLASIRTLHAARALCGGWEPDSDAAMSALVSSPHLDHLTTLDVSFNQLTAKAAEAVARRNAFVRLRALRLSHNALGDMGATWLSMATGLGHLEVLDLSHCGIRSPGARALSRASGLDKVQTLSLRGNKIGDEGVEALLGSALWRGVTHLDLRSVGLSAVGAAVLAHAEDLGALEVLRVSPQEIGEDGVSVLEASPGVCAALVL